MSPGVKRKHMLNDISWSQYLAGAAILLTLYYAAVAILYYRREIGAFFNSHKKSAATVTEGNDTPADKQQQTPPFEELEQTVKEIDSILKMAGKETSKSELLGQLRQRLAGYAGLRHPAYKVAVFNHIIKNAGEICGQRISVGELDSMMKGR